jgi:hypothetical protein
MLLLIIVFLYNYYFKNKKLILGDTALIAGIYGPTESRLHKIFHNKASVEASFGTMKGPSSEY